MKTEKNKDKYEEDKKRKWKSGKGQKSNRGRIKMIKERKT